MFAAPGMDLVGPCVLLGFDHVQLGWHRDSVPSSPESWQSRAWGDSYYEAQVASIFLKDDIS